MLALKLQLAPPVFGRSIFTRCEGFLEDTDHQHSLSWLTDVLDETEYHSTMDFVLCTVLPKFRPACIAFYEDEGPQLVKMLSSTRIERIDGILLQVLTNAWRHHDNERGCPGRD